MVSTVQEIEQLKECGISDFLYSVAVVPSKLHSWVILIYLLYQEYKFYTEGKRFNQNNFFAFYEFKRNSK